MIVQIRGTNGSGKTTIVNKIMERCKTIEPETSFLLPKRKKPAALICTHNGGSIAVIGHYDCPTGGCDTIQKQDIIFNLIRHYHDHGHAVLFEGIIVSKEVIRVQALHQDGYPYLGLSLDTSLQTCIDATIRRRLDKGTAAPLNTHNLKDYHRRTTLTRNRLLRSNIDCRWGNRDEVFEMALTALEVEHAHTQ